MINGTELDGKILLVSHPGLEKRVRDIHLSTFPSWVSCQNKASVYLKVKIKLLFFSRPLLFLVLTTLDIQNALLDGENPSGSDCAR